MSVNVCRFSGKSFNIIKRNFNGLVVIFYFNTLPFLSTNDLTNMLQIHIRYS